MLQLVQQNCRHNIVKFPLCTRIINCLLQIQRHKDGGQANAPHSHANGMSATVMMLIFCAAARPDSGRVRVPVAKE
ncbi:hypothetical protein BN2497_1457 [Janthinobacterium sp. CG23_2]|nr:hypothetical protein BN2497_1457 [Janthinobacterium sp. CG23_2]CUU27126.1 hypothetical protein BN3177_1457 [Janthinobacterium sp. CG23_2]